MFSDCTCFKDVPIPSIVLMKRFYESKPWIMENKVNPASEVPMIPEGFITLPNHSNCAKFEGNLSPPSAHGKVLVSVNLVIMLLTPF